VTADNKTDNQTVDNTRFIRKLKPIEYYFLGLQLSVYGYLSGMFVNLFIGLSGPPYSKVSANPYAFYAICFAIPALLLFLLFYRNRFFINRINRKSLSGFIYFSDGWRIAIPVMTGVLMFYYFFYAYTRDFRFYVVPFVVFFIMVSIFSIFDKPLTEEGETHILVDSVIQNLGNFEKTQFFWKKVAKRTEQKMRIGEVKVYRSDLVYYFSKKLLETNYDPSNDLICIRDWLLGDQRSCYEALTHIIPKNKIKRLEGATPPKTVKAQIEYNKMSNRLRRDWKVVVEIVGFAASIATIIALVLIIIG
jgi:hypothetical protein